MVLRHKLDVMGELYGYCLSQFQQTELKERKGERRKCQKSISAMFRCRVFFLTSWRMLLLVLVSLCTSLAAVLPGSPESHQNPLETHHSLHHPFDQSVVYWKYNRHGKEPY